MNIEEGELVELADNDGHVSYDGEIIMRCLSRERFKAIKILNG